MVSTGVKAKMAAFGKGFDSPHLHHDIIGIPSRGDVV